MSGTDSRTDGNQVNLSWPACLWLSTPRSLLATSLASGARRAIATPLNPSLCPSKKRPKRNFQCSRDRDQAEKVQIGIPLFDTDEFSL